MNRKHSIIAFVFLFFCIFNNVEQNHLFAQLLKNENGIVFTEEPYFNPDFIRKNKIETISGYFIYYKLGERIQDTYYYKRFTFNIDGQLIKEESCDEITENKGPLYTHYSYDLAGNLLSKVKENQEDVSGYFYQYDKKGRITRQEYRQNLTKNNEGKELLDERYSISSHRIDYAEYGDQLHKTIFNQANLPYMNVILYYDDSLHLLREVEERLHRTNATSAISYSYNNQQLIDTLRTSSGIQKNLDRMYVYDYDKDGNLLKREEFKDGQLISNYEIIYKDDTPYINDILMQDVTTKFIKILALRNYTFYRDSTTRKEE